MSVSANRLVSLDVFRGMTIAGMVLVNNPGGSPVYWPLDHAEWSGLTPTDWIFPFFLFIVGVSISIALGRTQKATDKVYGKVIRRAITIYLLGAAVSILPFFQFQSTDAADLLKLLIWLGFAAALFFALMRNWWLAGACCAFGLVGIAALNIAGFNVVPYNYGTLRIMGVLQRIAIVYLITAVIFLNTSWRTQVGISVFLLLAYWLIMTLIPVPGCDVTSISDKACNLAAYVDRVILTEDHIWRAGKVYDPEGLLSTIPAIVTCLSGVLAGRWLTSTTSHVRVVSRRSALSVVPDIESTTDSVATIPVKIDENSSRLNKVAGLFFFGAILLALGLIWNSYFPINKALWTSSYVLATSGLALLVFGCCYWLVDIKGYVRWSKPFVIFGVNALALFVFTGLFARMIAAYRVDGPDGKLISVQRWFINHVYLPIFDPIDASLAFAITFILFWLFLMWLLYRKKIYVKV